MIYEILDAFVDLSAVASIEANVGTELYGLYSIGLELEGVEKPFYRAVQKFTPGELQRGQQAFAHLRRELDELKRRQDGLTPRSTWPFRLGDQDIDLANVRAVEKVRRIVKEEFSSRTSRRSVIDVKFEYIVTIAGGPPIVRTLTNVADGNNTHLHHEQNKLLKEWINSFDRQAAA